MAKTDRKPTKAAVTKTNAARLLDQLGIRYELRAYEVDENDLAAETVAAKIGLPAEQVFKTLVARPVGSGSPGPSPGGFAGPSVRPAGGSSARLTSGLNRKDWHGVVMAVVPGDQEVDLKALAVAVGEKKMELVAVKELPALTGYIRGGVTALAAKREYPVFVDETIELFDVVSISAGMRGLQILIAPGDYLRAVKGRVAGLGVAKS